MARETIRLTLRLDPDQEVLLSELMIQLKINDKSKLFYRLLYVYRGDQKELKQTKEELYREKDRNEQLLKENKEIISALKIINKYSK